MKRTFKIDFAEGHLLIRYNEHIILVDTGNPVTMHKESTLNFLGREHRVLNKGVEFTTLMAGRYVILRLLQVVQGDGGCCGK